MRPLFSGDSRASRISTDQERDASEQASPTTRASRQTAVMGRLGDLVSHLRPSSITYGRRLNQVPTEWRAPSRGDKLIHLAVVLGKLSRPKRLPAFNEILDQIIGDTQSDDSGIRAHSGLPFELRPMPLAALAFQIGNLPDPAARVNAFYGVLEGYKQLTQFVSQNRQRGISTSLIEVELEMLHAALESAVDHLPENERPSASKSLEAIR